MNPSKRRPDWATLTVAGLLAVVAVVILWDVARLPQTGGYSGVGPAEVPRWVAYGLLVLAGWSAIAAFREAPEETPAQDIPAVLWVAAGLVAQILLLIPAGFSIATGLLFAFTARGFGKRKLAITIPVGIVFAFVIFAVFGGLLKLSLPAGPLERLIMGG